jgi:hypothetical protein
MLANVPKWGTGRRADLKMTTAAGKTGTTQSYRDAWFVGYTGNYTAAVWYGNDNYQPTNRLTGGSLPAMTWQRIMEFAHTGIAPLAAAEGLSFTLRADIEGRPLNAACRYRVSGTTPPSRAWTLRVQRGGIPYSVSKPDLAVAAHSQGLVRQGDGEIAIAVSPVPVPGNWIYAGPDGPFSLVMTLYDTAIASDTGLTTMTMPAVTLEVCGDG